MQKVIFCQTPPVASVQGGAITQKKCRCDWHRSPTCNDQQRIVRQRSAQKMKKLPSEIARMTTALGIGVAINRIEYIPVGGCDPRSGFGFKLEALGHYLAPLPVDIFAFARRHARYKIIETGIAVIKPMKLTPGARADTGLLQWVMKLFNRK